MLHGIPAFCQDTLCPQQHRPEYGVIMEKEDFADSVDLAFLVKSEFSDKLKKQLTDISCGKLELSEETNLLADFA